MAMEPADPLTPAKSAGSPASKHAAHDAADRTADRANRTAAATAVTTGVSPAAFFITEAGLRRSDGFGHERLMLRRVEKAGPGITARQLPAHDDGAGAVVELSTGFGVEAETGQPALHVAPLSLIKSYLIFGFLSCLVGKCRRIDGSQQVAIGHARTGRGNICTDENSKS